MAEFGRRQTAQFGQRNSGAGDVARSPKITATPASMAAAAEVLAKGKMPKWTNTGPGGLATLVLLFAGVFFYFAYAYGGEILRDHRLAGTWQPAYDMRASDGRCHRVQLILTFCSAKLASEAESDKAPVEAEIMMGFTSGGGELLVPMRSTRDPSAVTIAYFAENKLGNRTLTFLVMEGMMAAAALAGLRALRRGRYKGGAQHLELLAGLASLQARMEREEAPAPLKAAA